METCQLKDWPWHENNMYRDNPANLLMGEGQLGLRATDMATAIHPKSEMAASFE